MITFVCWRWEPAKGYRSTFSPFTVYALRDMLKKHYHRPHRFVCVTDTPDQLVPAHGYIPDWECHGIETIKLWDDCSQIPSPIGRSYPSCYRRLKLFAPDAGMTFGHTVVSIDLDTVITGDVTPLFDRKEDFVIWGESDFPQTTPCCGSLWMLRTGTRNKVWTEFNPEKSPREAIRHGCRGSDQGWIAYILQNRRPAQGHWKEATWGRADGVFSYRKHIKRIYANQLPPEAKLVSFHGKVDPWGKEAQALGWVREHYPLKKKTA